MFKLGDSSNKKKMSGCFCKNFYGKMWVGFSLNTGLHLVAEVSFYQGGLNKKEIQLNLYNIFSIFIFNELYLLA